MTVGAARGKTVVSVGVHILDVLGRPVSDIPPGQGRRILEEIRLTAAGTAAGTSVDLAKLGIDVVAIGAVGDDLAGSFLLTVMGSYGIDASRVVRKRGVQTSSTILPIRPDGQRPALHVPGATALLELDDVDLSAVTRCDVLHVGGPDALQGLTTEDLGVVLEGARGSGALTTMDVLSPCDGRVWQRIRPLMPHLSAFLPNQEQLRNLTGADDVAAGAGTVLDAGALAVLVSLGPEGCAYFGPEGHVEVPALATTVVDTTGCGDAVTAGYIAGLLHGLSATDAVWLASAAAALVAGGLGSDAGIVDFERTAALARQHAPSNLAPALRNGGAHGAVEPADPGALPRYDELPVLRDGSRASWGLFGPTDSVGLVQLQTPERVAAAARLIVTGEVFSLNAEHGILCPPLFSRGTVRHTVFTTNGGEAFDDKLDEYFPQASSQWDSLAHVGIGPGTFYNGATGSDVRTGRRNTVDHWARRGIAGRAVLVDVDRVLGGAGKGFDPGDSRQVTVDELEEGRAMAGITYETGDILVLHTGFLAWYRALDPAHRERLARPGGLRTVGIARSEAMARYLWDAHIAGIVSDNPAVEVWPPDPTPTDPFGFLHRSLIGRFGMALGELFWLHDLARSCRADGRYAFFLTAAPLHVPGAVGSPANALAIK